MPKRIAARLAAKPPVRIQADMKPLHPDERGGTDRNAGSGLKT
jgi:hypothetical protein